MEEMNNNLEVLAVVEDETTPVYEEFENEAELVAEEHSSNLIVVGTGLAIAAVTGGALLMKKLKEKKKAKIEQEAYDKMVEILKQSGQTDEQIETFMNTMKEHQEKEENSKQKKRIKMRKQNDNEEK